jgi:pimeloyl-ACP methyl ester carboxylesterase
MDKPVILLTAPSGSGKPAFAQLLHGWTMAKQRGRYETVSIDDSLTDTAADSTERIYRHCFDKAVLYIHGKGGSAAECEYYKPLLPECEVIGLDYQTFTPWETGAEIRATVEGLNAEGKRVILVANSIGAYFSMNAGIDGMIEKAWFISPVVDMERLITDMMRWADVTEAEMETRGTIHTAFGEDLSWNYLCYVRSHPIRWTVPTRILYGSLDNLTPFETIRDFAKKHHAALTVMEGGEHWFHTEEQMRFLDGWILGK